jgi:hypothetical protein
MLGGQTCVRVKQTKLTDVLKAPDPTNLCLRCRFFLKYAFIID